MMVSPKRAENVAWLSLVLSTVFFITAFLLGRWSGFFAVTSVSWLILSSALIWFVMSSQFHQRSSAEQEKLDVSQLTETDEATKLFQTKGQHAEMFAIAQNRLKLLEKWFIPIFAALIAIFQIFIGLYLLKNISLGPDIQTQQPLICAVYMTGIAFVSFLISRYATGMSYQLQWKPLRAGGSIMFCAAVLCFALAIALALANFKIYLLLQIIQWVIPVLIIILGTETALNVVLDIYRPRIKDQYKRSAFDSRLLGIINEPGKIFHTAASTIDYQFGFKVSQTWFYKLLEKAVMPLLLFGFVALYSLSCVVIVSPNEQAIIEHFGDPVKDSDVVRIFGPGLTFKWPWPIDIAYKYPTKKISEITIGLAAMFGTLAILFLGFIDPAWQFNPQDNGMNWFDIYASGLLLLAAIVIVALAVAFSARFNIVVTLSGCVGIFLLGLISDYTFGRFADTHLWAKIGRFLVPNLQVFWISDAIYEGSEVPLKYIAISGCYALCYSAAIISFAIAVFQRRQIG